MRRRGGEDEEEEEVLAFLRVAYLAVFGLSTGKSCAFVEKRMGSLPICGRMDNFPTAEKT
jgi:hypothetical protein